jgi:tRNA U34 5-methylaminomethyl-2-thiouridine-forming methyltransferase MnmC
MASWQPEPTKDGSFTFFSPEFQETFHSRQGAKAEAVAKFVEATDLEPKVRHQSSIRWLDVCYGLGYNSAAALTRVWQVNPHCQVEIIGLELDPTVPIAAITPTCLEIWPKQIHPMLKGLARDHQFQGPNLQARLLIGDARQQIQEIQGLNDRQAEPQHHPRHDRQHNHQTKPQHHPQPDRPSDPPWQADVIFLDPFSPRRCPQLWTVEFLAQVARCLKPNGKLATYSRAAAVRVALEQAGLAIGTLPLPPIVKDGVQDIDEEGNVEPYPAHEWSQGTIASFNSHDLTPLSAMEREHLQTRAAIPYRDPTLQDPASVILTRRQQEQQASTRESTTSWRRRWGLQP